MNNGIVVLLESLHRLSVMEQVRLFVSLMESPPGMAISLEEREGEDVRITLQLRPDILDDPFPFREVPAWKLQPWPCLRSCQSRRLEPMRRIEPFNRRSRRHFG